MPDFWIHNCDIKQFDAYEFFAGKGKSEHVEGALWKLNYYPQAALTAKPSELQIMRNFENAIKKLGGTTVATDKGKETLKLTKDGKEIWIEVRAEFTSKHSLLIVQKEAMTQDIVANAAAFASDLKSSGHVAIYGIYFDTNKATLKPESTAALDEITKLLATDPTLKLYVVGHTDNTGNVDANLKLSQERGEAVLQALVRDHGVATARLKASGCGPFSPVAPNDSDEGKARNRRVELVKQ